MKKAIMTKAMAPDRQLMQAIDFDGQSASLLVLALCPRSGRRAI